MIPNILDRFVQSAATTGNGTAVEAGGCRVLTAYVIGNGAVGAGAVTLEHSHSKDYTGTWAAIGTAITVVANGVAAVQIAGTFKAVRARISTTVTGGTCSVLLVGN